jgi:hypothetical protein
MTKKMQEAQQKEDENKRWEGELQIREKEAAKRESNVLCQPMSL